MNTGFKQLERFTLSAALAVGLIGITGTAQAARSNCNSMNRQVSYNYNQFHSRMTISHVQRRLRRDGYYKGTVDGLDGPATHAALRHFQRDNGLAISGRLTPRTMSALGVPVTGTASRSQNWNQNNSRNTSDNSGAYGFNGNMQPQPSQNNMQPQSSQNNMPAAQANNGNQNNTASREDTSKGAVAQQPSSVVRTAQRDLQQQGFYSGAVNGILGPQTRDAIRKYQRTNNLNDTGRLDQQTLSRLGVD